MKEHRLLHHSTLGLRVIKKKTWSSSWRRDEGFFDSTFTLPKHVSGLASFSPAILLPWLLPGCARKPARRSRRQQTDTLDRRSLGNEGRGARLGVHHSQAGVLLPGASAPGIRAQMSPGSRGAANKTPRSRGTLGVNLTLRTKGFVCGPPPAPPSQQVQHTRKAFERRGGLCRLGGEGAWR